MMMMMIIAIVVTTSDVVYPNRFARKSGQDEPLTKVQMTRELEEHAGRLG